MSAKILDFHRTNQVAHFWRLGSTGQHKLAELQACGDLRFDRVVVDASKVAQFGNFLNILRSMGSDLILDTKVAEQTHGTGSKSSASLPWLRDPKENQLTWLMQDRHQRLYAERIAEFATKHRVSAIMAPTHYLASANDGWLPVDLDLCNALREALDTNGSDEISIEYPLVTKATALNEFVLQPRLMEGLSHSAYDNLWLQLSGFGNTASAAGLRGFINASWGLKQIGKPIVADFVGGLVGLGILAFGAVGGIAHGIAKKESLNVQNWQRKNAWGGGLQQRIYFPSLDLYLYREQAEKLLAKKGMKSRLLSPAEHTSPNTLKELFADPDLQFIHHRSRQISTLNEIPRSRRRHHFMNDFLQRSVSEAKQSTNLRFDDEKIATKLEKHSARLNRLYRSLSDLQRANPSNEGALIPERCKLKTMRKQSERGAS